MLFVNRYGDNFHIEDDRVPDVNRDWLWNKTYMFPDDARLEECWVASVSKCVPMHSDQYEYVGEKVYDHEPTKEELLWLMAHFDAVRYSYVTVDKALRYAEEED